MSHFNDKMHQIRFLVSVRFSVCPFDRSDGVLHHSCRVGNGRIFCAQRAKLYRLHVNSVYPPDALISWFIGRPWCVYPGTPEMPYWWCRQRNGEDGMVGIYQADVT